MARTEVEETLAKKKMEEQVKQDNVRAKVQSQQNNHRSLKPGCATVRRILLDHITVLQLFLTVPLNASHC